LINTYLDVDIGMEIEEFDQRIIDKFLGNKNLKLIQSFGLPNESYELRFRDGSFLFDCFFIYKYNRTHRFIPYFSDNFVTK
jgi:hypothetical protein